MNLSSKSVGVIIIALFISIIGGSKIAGIWITESTKEPAVFNHGDFKGMGDPSDIRGSYTFADISKSFNIPIEDLAVAFNINMDNPQNFKVKELEDIYLKSPNPVEIGTASVRYYVALYNSVPYIKKEDEKLLKEGVDLLDRKGKLTKEEKEYLKTHTITLK